MFYDRFPNALKGLTFFVAAFAVTGCGGPADSGRQEMPPTPVTVVEVHPETVEVEADYAGRARGAREVEVRARVGGILEERLYEEGHRVEAGEELFQIDRRPYEIAVRQAEAEVANAQAARNQAEREWERVSDLFEQDVISERERDRAVSDLELAQARVELAEAQLAEAELNVEYTRVEAPIPGQTGLETLSEGSLIEAGRLLTTIVQQDPVHVRFALPENDAAIQREARSAMVNPGESHRRQARLLLPGGALYELAGEVDFTDSTIDPSTGTVSARAVFPNPEGVVIPGQFVRVRLSLERLDDVFRVDPTAVVEGPEGAQVFLLQDDETVAARTVRLGPLVDGRQVILDGLTEGDRLVVNGVVALQDGMQVAAQTENGGS